MNEKSESKQNDIYCEFYHVGDDGYHMVYKSEVCKAERRTPGDCHPPRVECTVKTRRKLGEF
jgi:hypothetical protein